MNTAINYDIKIDYNNNKGYRETLRKILRMEKQYYIEYEKIIFKNGIIINKEDIDEETLDEMDLDELRYDECFKHILEITKDIEKMVKLYEWSSNKYMSLDIEVGIANLLSYHNLPYFYEILCKLNKSGIDKNDKVYNEIITDEMINNIKNI